MTTSEIKIDFNSYLKYAFTLSYTNPWILVFTSLSVLLIVKIALYYMGFEMLRYNGPEAFIALYGLLLIPAWVYFRARRNFYSNSKLRERMVYEFTPDKIKVTGQTFASEYDWSTVYRVRKIGGCILLYQSRILANIVPIESLRPHFEEFRGLVKSKGIRTNM